MRSADESETSKVVPKSEGRPENQQGEAGIISLQSDSGISVPVQSIANITTALITSAIPLTVLQNGLSLSAPLMVTQSTFQNANPSLLEFKGQAAQILPNDLGLRLVTGDRSFRPPVVIGLPAGTVGNPAVAMPIKMETNDDDFSETDDESSSNQEWASPGSSALLSDESAVDYSVNAPNYSSASSTAGAKTGTKKFKTSGGTRRNCKDAKLTPEEEERRKQRRERNKLAAAKCRQKRVDQTNQLLTETQVLEEEQSRLEEEIKKYQQQKEELEFVLEAHRLHCGLGKQQSASLAPPTAPALTQNPPPVASLPIEIQPIVKPEVTVETTKELKPQVATTQGHRVLTLMQRPTSFPVASRSLASGASMLEQALGIPMSTPSSGIVITLGLDSMLDGHTGLTPITGVPSIVAQTPQNPPSNAVPSSSDTLNPTSTALMSL